MYYKTVQNLKEDVIIHLGTSDLSSVFHTADFGKSM